MKNRNMGYNPLCKLVLLTLMFQEGNHGKFIKSVIGPYISYTERFYMCEPNNRLLPWRWNLRPSHFNPYKPKELQLMTGNVTAVNVTLDDHCWTKAILDIRSNNQWKENAFVFNFKKNGCRNLKDHTPGFYKQVLRGKDGDACIRQPGVYEVNNIPVDWNFPKFPTMPYGYYRFRLMFGKAENLYACWVVEAKTVPN